MESKQRNKPCAELGDPILNERRESVQFLWVPRQVCDRKPGLPNDGQALCRLASLGAATLTFFFDKMDCLLSSGGSRAFYGTSENAVKTQIWIAVSMYVLVAIVRKQLELDASLYQILQILSVSLFEKTPISCALQAIDEDANFAKNVNQLILFDF